MTAVTSAWPRGANGDCARPRAMIVLDKSSSMQTGTIGGQTKWSIAVDALDVVLAEYQSKIELGLLVFPTPNQCSPGDVVVQPALSQRSPILNALNAPPPASGNYTPIAQTLSAAAEEPSLATGAMPRYAVLITDGWQWCSPYDPSTRFDAVDALSDLNAAGVKTYVVGFGNEVDALLLNKVAVKAGTAIPGCDPNGDTPTAAKPCYYQADDPAELVAALMEIATDVSDTEICDGEDNDCDGKVDEDLTRPCESECGAGEEVCEDGTWGECSAQDPKTEVCDGDDNDCDGTIDEGNDDVGLCGAEDPQDPNPGDPDGEGGSPAGGCGCATGGSRAGSLLGLGIFGAIVGWRLRRRRRTR